MRTKTSVVMLTGRLLRGQETRLSVHIVMDKLKQSKGLLQHCHFSNTVNSGQNSITNISRTEIFKLYIKFCFYIFNKETKSSYLSLFFFLTKKVTQTRMYAAQGDMKNMSKSKSKNNVHKTN